MRDRASQPFNGLGRNALYQSMFPRREESRARWIRRIHDKRFGASGLVVPATDRAALLGVGIEQLPAEALPRLLITLFLVSQVVVRLPPGAVERNVIEDVTQPLGRDL